MRASCSRLGSVAHALAAVSLLGTGVPLQAEPKADAGEAQTGVTHVVPVGPWNLDYGQTDCLLQRSFEKDGERYLVSIKQNAPGQNFSLTVAGPELKRLISVKELTLALSDSGPRTLTRSVMAAQTPDYDTAFVIDWVTLDRGAAPGPASLPGLRSTGIDPVQAAKADRIVLANGNGKKGVWFETGSLKPAFAALNTCTDDLLTEWGLDPAQHRSYAPPVMRNASEISRSLLAKFPTRAAAFGESGFFSFRVIVEADGTVSSCHIEARTKVNYLDPRCNDVLRIAKFDPARDAQGNPMRSFFATSISYVVP